MNILILGGCHTYAFGIDDIENGYFQTLMKKNEELGEVVNVTAFAPITIKNSLNLIVSKQLDLSKYDMVILQFGNHEFELGASEFFQLFAKKYTRKYDISGSKFTKQLTPQLIEERRNWYKEDYSNKLVKGFKKITSIFLGSIFLFLDIILNYPRFVWYEKLIGDFFREVEQHKNKIICLGVFPCLYSFRQSLRKKGNSIIETECKKHKVKFLDLIDSNLDKTFFLPDEVHLNEKGHRFVFEKIYNLLESKGILSNKIDY